MRGTFATALTFCVAAALAAGCGDDVPLQQQVENLRILALRADKPEVRLSDIAFTDVTVDALVADPKGEGRPVTLEWGVCGFQIGSTSLQSFDCFNENSLAEPGSGTRYTVNLAAVALKLIESLPTTVPSATGAPSTATGINLPGNAGNAALPLIVALRARAGDEESVAYKTVSLSNAETVNENPELAAVLLDGRPLDPGGLNVIEAGRFYKLDPIATDTSAEEYPSIDLEGNAITAKEEMLFSFLADSGNINKYRSAQNAPNDSVVLGAPLLMPANSEGFTLWVVIRDGRGGQGWQTFQMRALPSGQFYPARRLFD